MANFLLIGICIVAGLLVRRFTAIPADAYKGVNALIINLALPAVAFKYLPHIQWTKSLILPAAMPVVVWLCGWIYIKAYAAKAKLDKQTENGLKLVTGLGNTSFLGFPLIIAWFSDDALGIAVICDQVTFTLLATAGIVVAMNASEKHSLSVGAVFKKMFSFPPFIGCVEALILPLFINLSAFDALFDMLAATVAPLALFSIGLQLKFDGWRRELNHLAASFLYKLVLAPLVIFSIVYFLGMKGIIPQISIFESAMPSHLTATIVASEYNLNPKLTSLVDGFGIVLSFVTTALWFFIIKGLH